MRPHYLATLCLIPLLTVSCRNRSEGAAEVPPPMPSPTQAATVTPDPWAEKGAPARIQIEAIGVDAALERLGLTSDQRIGVPDEWQNAGWYDVGFRPGEQGSAVISGHYDTDEGEAAVFYRLGELKVGDKIVVSYPDGEVYDFVVDGQRMAEAESVDAETWEAIFGPAESPRLSLITCDGVWNESLGGYDQRLIYHAGLRESP
jgi:LPXTG-site transpeptidase (sortase) family protein